MNMSPQMPIHVPRTVDGGCGKRRGGGPGGSGVAIATRVSGARCPCDESRMSSRDTEVPIALAQGLALKCDTTLGRSPEQDLAMLLRRQVRWLSPSIAPRSAQPCNDFFVGYPIIGSTGVHKSKQDVERLTWKAPTQPEKNAAKPKVRQRSEENRTENSTTRNKKIPNFF